MNSFGFLTSSDCAYPHLATLFEEYLDLRVHHFLRRFMLRNNKLNMGNNIEEGRERVAT